MFIVTKLLECDLDALFYKILEQREVIRKTIIENLEKEEREDEWVKKMIEIFQDNNNYLFMPFSHEQLMAKEQLEKELESNVTLNVLLEQGKLNDYLAPKYF